MTKLAAIADHLDPETLALAEEAARVRGVSVDRFAADAIRQMVEEEREWLAFLDAGIADLDAGRTISHEELLDRIAARRLRGEAA